jgi:uncharacterized protein (TIGR00106 family)
MSVLVQFTMFPTDKGISVSTYVSRIIAMIRELNFPYQLHAMGTIIETETLPEALSLIDKAYNLLAGDSERVHCMATFDIRKSQKGRLSQKVDSIEKLIGKVAR